MKNSGKKVIIIVRMMKIDVENPSIMNPMNSLTLVKAELSDAMKPDVVSEGELRSVPFLQTDCDDSLINHTLVHHQNGISNLSFPLMGRDEKLLVGSEEEFVKKLGCTENDKIKVVSIFGNTGDGKSHTMNYTFFNGEQIFQTSTEQQSCTIGVMAAMQRKMNVLCLDTEGFLGTTTNPDRRMRMLLKILAISDIIIFRTRTERLNREVYQFLSNASQAFSLHFASALQSLELPDSTRALGPAVIIFQETRYTKPLESTIDESVEDKLRANFRQLNMTIDAFSSIRYIGLKTDEATKKTNFISLLNLISNEISNKSVRSPRQPGVVYKALKSLNLKYSGEVKNINPFPEQYFTCGEICESCAKRCQRSMGHINDGEDHDNNELCIYQHQLDNKVYMCKKCHTNGKKVIVIVNSQSQTNTGSTWTGFATYAWKGAVIECPSCGEIYRSRQYWYGNKSPEETAVRSEIVHVWKGGSRRDTCDIHSGQILLDGVNFITGAIGNVVQQPTKAISDWVADKAAPSYWVPNSEITVCETCRKNFEKTGLRKHHCRGCGKGFCNACSKHKMPVPGRGWYEDVRVCHDCRQELLKGNKIPGSLQQYQTKNDETDIIVRKYGETVFNALTHVAGVLEYPKDFIKDTARPSYWVKDSDAANCSICEIPFGTAEELESVRAYNENQHNRNNTPNTSPTTERSKMFNIPKSNGNCYRHHCRSCGQTVCDLCSQHRRPVPERGWQNDVRVCDACYKTKSD